MASAKEMLEQIGNIFGELSVAQKVIGAVFVAAVFGGMILLSTREAGTTYQVLFSSLSQEDAADVVARLKEMRVPYQVDMNGSVVKVPAGKVLETRLSLAGEGLPKGGGVGFEIFDKTNLGETDFVQRLNYQRALQGELARTIRQFSQVSEARVHIATPKESIFIEEEKEPTASVSLRMRGKNKLSQHQIQAVVNLVSSAVPGLTENNITIVDTAGRLLYRKRGDDIASVNGTQLEYQMRMEKSMRDKVETMLEEIVGAGKALARVSTDIDFSQVDTTEELFDPEGQVVRSESLLNEEHVKKGEEAKGIPGVKGELATFAEEGDQGAGVTGSNLRNNVTRNYEVSKTIKHVKSASGLVKRLSVAVMVDGTYEKVVDKEGKASLEYKPRSADDLKWFENMVKNAVGFDPERGDQVEVVSMSFASSGVLEPEAEMFDKMRPVIEMVAMPLVYLITALCVIFFVIKPLFELMSKKQLQIQEQVLKSELEEELGAEEPEDLTLAPLALSDREKIYKLAQSDPERAADLVRRWLREEI